jgi:hypothetical protein
VPTIPSPSYLIGGLPRALAPEPNGAILTAYAVGKQPAVRERGIEYMIDMVIAQYEELGVICAECSHV